MIAIAQKNQQGLTIVELMVAMTIIATIAGIVAYSAFGVIEPAKVKEAEIEIQQLNQMVEHYYVAKGQGYPSKLGALTDPPPIAKKIPNDPWGNPYGYEKGGSSFLVRSAGPDGEFDTEDDVTGSDA